MKPLISTIIPAFNAAETLIETIDSIGAQSMRPVGEVIVVDDGSNDSTAAMAERHPLAPRVLRVANGGAPAAMNIGIEASQGQYICFLDADDLWTKDKLERQYEVLTTRPEIAFVLGHAEAFECPTVPSQAFENVHYVQGKTPGFLCGAMMARRNLFSKRVGNYDETLKTGYFIDWFRKAQSAGVRYEMMPEVVHRRRIRPNTLSRRSAGSSGMRPDQLSRDFLEIARRAIREKRNAPR